MKTLREWRVARLMSVRDLAKAAGTSNKTIIELEYGRQRPQYRTMRRIAAALEVAAAEIAEFAATIDEQGKEVAAA